MESEKRAKRPRIGMSNREGATERYEKVEYRRNGGEEGHSSYSANAERPYYPRNNYGDGGNRSYGNETFHRTERRTMNHYRTVLLVVSSRIIQLEAFGQVIVYLDRKSTRLNSSHNA